MPGRGQEYHFKSLVEMNKEIKRKKKQGYEVVHAYGTRKGKSHIMDTSPTGSGYVSQPGTLFIVEFRRKKNTGSRGLFGSGFHG